MHILITNDDGIYAPGIRSLIQGLQAEHRLTVVAPLEERSTTSHRLSLESPLRLEEIAPGQYGCSGFPADCTFLALNHVLQDDLPDLVISGINSGPNLAQDVYYSGTVAAAREACFHDIPAIALSLALDYRKIQHANQGKFATAAQVVKHLLQQPGLLAEIPAKQLLNINVPDLEFSELKGLEWSNLGFRRYSKNILARLDNRDRDYYWIGGALEASQYEKETDCFAVEQGKVSLTLLTHLNSAAPPSETLKQLTIS